MKQKNDPSNPIELDSDQLRNLEELINSLKKGIMVPGRKDGSEPSEHRSEYNNSSSKIHSDALSLKPQRMLFGGRPDAMMASI